MPQIYISPAYCVLLVAVVTALAYVSLSNRKMSIGTLRKSIEEYECFTDRCNELISSISELVDRLQERCFDSDSDEEYAVALVKQYQSLYNDLFLCNEKIGLYLKKRNLKYYRKNKKQADMILHYFENIFSSLEELEHKSLTREEWEYKQRVRQAEKFYEEYMSKNREDPFRSSKSTDKNKSTNTNTENKHQTRQESYQNKGNTNKQDESSSSQENSRQSNSANQNQSNYKQPSSITTDVYFVGCNTKEEVEKRYRALAKVYHPDMPNGDKDTFQKLHDEYERKKGML